jgi:CII-binding regulator of phage lambda lysogenization HflD
MADALMTEYQGDRIIRLLEKIEAHLDSIKTDTSSIDRSTDQVVSELASIEVNTRD